jgi:hypothetical protein
MSRVTTFAPTALLATRSTSDDGVSEILRELGFDAVQINGKDSVDDFLEPISLCVVDLQENGDALRIARAVRSRHPEAVVIGVADPARPQRRRFGPASSTCSRGLRLLGTFRR